MPLPAQGSFRTKESELRVDLERAYRNIVQAVADVEANAEPAPSVVQVAGKTWRAQAGDCLVISGQCAVTLPDLTGPDAGKTVTILRNAGTITARSASAKVNGSTADVFSSGGRRVYQFSGTNWFR